MSIILLNQKDQEQRVNDPARTHASIRGKQHSALALRLGTGDRRH